MSFEVTDYLLEEVVLNFNSNRVPLSSSERLTRQGVYPYYGAQSIIDYIDDFIFDGEYILIAEDGDNLVSKKQKVANIARGRFWVNNHAHIIKNNDKSDFHYLYYLLNSIDISAYVTGSAQPKLSKGNLNKISIKLPYVKIQKKIACILSTLDDKIELNNRMNKALEQIAQAIFKQWFVDFEFPNENGEPYKSSGGEMEWCEELGKEIPLGWQLRCLKELCELITKGTTPTTLGRSFVDKGINFIKAESITDSHTFDSAKFTFIDEETNKLLKRSIIKERDILFTIAGTLGRYAIATYDVLPANTNQAVAIIRTNDSMISPYYILSYFLSDEHKHFYSARTQQAVQANLSLTTIGELLLAVPPEAVLESYYQVIDGYFIRMNNTVKQNNILSNLRDTLLPKLMSGEIDVSQIEL